MRKSVNDFVSQFLYSLFSATPESFAAKTAVVKLQGLNPRDVFEFFPPGSYFFFQKNIGMEGLIYPPQH